MLWCNGKQQNGIMMLESNHDNRFIGVVVGAKASAANGKIIICKHDSNLKKIGKSKRRATLLDRHPFLAPKVGQRLVKWLPKWSRYREKSNPKND